MTEKQLKSARILKAEIEMLENEIYNIQAQRKSLEIRDSVISSSSEFPYTKRAVSITGIPLESGELARALTAEEKLKVNILEVERDKLRAELGEIEAFRRSIDDRLIKKIIFLRCEKLLKWDDVAAHIRRAGLGNYSGDGLRITLSRFLARHG